ncbi:MAG: UMP kinase [Pseudomonadales bacterium]
MRRVLLKLSGEALAGKVGYGIDPGIVRRICKEIATAVTGGVQIGLVIGGGNLFRGATLQAAGMDRVTGDQMGMLATVMNGLAFRDMLRAQGLAAQALSAVEISGVVAKYERDLALRLLESGSVVLFVAGTGNPFFTTDTAACLRGIEIGADVVLKATKVDGVYSADPMQHPDAERFDEITYDEVLARNLQVMDQTAISLCRDHDMPLVVFDMGSADTLTRIINGDKVGTRIVPVRPQP